MNFCDYIRTILEQGGVVVIGVFTQPYCKVEENFDIVTMYNNFLQDENLKGDHKKRLKYYHLADYGTRTITHETLVWYLSSSPHDQDIALQKEVARYKGQGLNFGVCVYAQFPGTQFSVVKGTDGVIDYWKIQREVEEQEVILGTEQILHQDEYYISQLPIQFTFISA